MVYQRLALLGLVSFFELRNNFFNGFFNDVNR
uniref:Uncharacterized protein n=1 Tax=Rhizophora mucronata TaxID=61149 RepID=A0A2P2MTE0_RHIMU